MSQEQLIAIMVAILLIVAGIVLLPLAIYDMPLVMARWKEVRAVITCICAAAEVWRVFY